MTPAAVWIQFAIDAGAPALVTAEYEDGSKVEASDAGVRVWVELSPATAALLAGMSGGGARYCGGVIELLSPMEWHPAPGRSEPQSFVELLIREEGGEL